MPKPFILHSNIDGKERVSIRKENLDKLTDDDWAELNSRNVHVCILDLSEDLNIKAVHSSREELDAALKEVFNKAPSGKETEDTLPN